MTRRQWTAFVACVGFAAGLWLAIVPYHHRVFIGRLALSGRCPSAVTVAFRRVPEPALFDLPAGARLPAELCIRSARRRLGLGVMFALVGGAILVAGWTTWAGGAGDS